MENAPTQVQHEITKPGPTRRGTGTHTHQASRATDDRRPTTSFCTLCRASLMPRQSCGGAHSWRPAPPPDNRQRGVPLRGGAPAPGAQARSGAGIRGRRPTQASRRRAYTGVACLRGRSYAGAPTYAGLPTVRMRGYAGAGGASAKRIFCRTPGGGDGGSSRRPPIPKLPRVSPALFWMRPKN